MGKFSRGNQLSDKGREIEGKRRKQRLADRGKAQRKESLRRLSKKLIIVLIVLFILIVLVNRQIIKLAEGNLNANYFNTAETFFGDNFLSSIKLFFSEDELESFMVAAHPEISHIEVRSSFFGNTTINVVQNSPAFYWMAGNSLYLGNDEGIIYKPAEAENGLNLPQFRDQASIDVTPGDRVIPPSTLAYITEVETELAVSNLHPDHYVIPEAAREIHIHLKDKAYFVKVSLDRSVVGQLDELFQAIEYIDKTKKDPEQYIDIRTADRVYYK